MPKERVVKRFPQSTLSFVAGGLFCLAGVVEVATAWLGHKAVFLSIGTMFLSLGALWFAVGANYKKKEVDAARGE